MADFSRRLAELSDDKRSLLERVLRRDGQASSVPVLPRGASAGRSIPLTFTQESLWFMCQLASDSTLYNLPSAVRLRGELDRGALERALREIVRRHEILRTRFLAEGGKPKQDILAEMPFSIPLVDLGDHPAHEREDRARTIALDDAQRPFDLAEGPLFRFSLQRLADDDHVLVIVFHHLVWDGWSIGVMSRELAALYRAYREGAPSPLADLNIQYADYTLWEREQLTGEALDEALAYWRPRLTGAPFASLPTDRPRPNLPTFSGAVAPIALSPPLTAAVLDLSARAGTTAFMTLLAAFQIVLARTCDNPRVAIGTPVANRRRAELEGLIGLFANLLVMTADVAEDTSFESHLARVKEMATSAYAHQGVPFELLVDKLRIERDQSKNPIFQVLFAVHMDRLDATIELPFVTISPFPVSDDHSHFDLGVHLFKTPDGLAGYASYNRDLYHPSTITRLLEHFITLLEALVRAPDQPISQSSMLTAEEQRALVSFSSRGANPASNEHKTALVGDALRVTTTDLAAMLTEGDDGRLQGASRVVASGARLRAAVVDAFYRRFPSSTLLHAYAPPESATEVSVAVTAPGAAPAAVPDRAPVHVLDRRGRHVPIGVTGVVHLADASNPEVPRVATWDRAMWLADGSLCLTGAEGRRVYRSGERVDLDAVEALLLKHPAVDACRVIAREHETREEIVAYVVPSGAFHEASILDHLRAHLAPAAIPSAIVALSALPRGADGLTDDRALASFPVLDAALAARFRARIEASAMGSPARVIAAEPYAPPALSHVADLLPGYRLTRAEERTTTSSTGAVRGDVEGARPAITDGGLLDVPADAPATLPAALLRAADLWPDHGARVVRGEGDEVFLSYPALLRAARSVLTGLRAAGLGPGSQVILQIDELEDYFVALWGCLLGGIAPVTVSTTTAYDRKSAVVGKLYGTWELLHRPPVIASAKLAPDLEGVCALFRDDGARFVVLAFDALASCPEAADLHSPAPDDLAFLQLTSGSTGVPKCIQETHRACIHHILGARQMHGFGPDQVHLNWLPMDHSVPILLCHIKDTYLGIQQVHAKPEVVLGDPLAWLDMMERHRVTHTWSPNFGYKLVNDALAKNPQRTWDLSSFAYTMNGAEQVTLPVAEEFMRRLVAFGASPAAMTPAFGMAELATGITYNKDWDRGLRAYWIKKSSLTGVLEDAPAADPDAIPFICVGKPLPGVAIRIVDGENRVLPERVIGVLQIKSPCVTAGYLHNEVANREVFVEGGWFSSGDLGFLEGGRLTITGRQKEMIVVRGVNYYCYELEDAVGTLEGVEPTFVAACSVDDPETGTDGLAIFYVPKSEGIEASLVQSIQAKITADFGLSPRYVVPIDKESFPKTTSGKVQRTQLKKDLVSGKFDDRVRRVDLALESDNTVPAWFFRPAWMRAEIGATAARKGAVLVVLDDAGLGEAIAARLGDAAVCVRVARGDAFARLGPRRYAIRAGEAGDHLALRDALAVDGIAIDRALHLRGYGPAGAGQPDLEAAHRDGAACVLGLAQALAAEARPIDLIVVASHTHRGAAGDRVAYERAPVRGLVKAIAHEWPALTARHVDLPYFEASNVDQAANVDRVIREMDGITKDWEVRYQGGARLVRRIESIHLAGSPACAKIPWNEGDLVLIAGGLGGVGSAVARHLVEQHKLRLVLVGRTQLAEDAATEAPTDVLAERRTPAELRKALADLERAGDVAYEVADVTDLPVLKAIVARAEERTGARLAGVIHLAGVFPTRLLSEETAETLWETIRPKLEGGVALADLVRGGGFFVAFDTVYSLFGGVAVGAYAAANAGLAAFVADDPIARSSFAWSHWDETGMSRGYALRAASIAAGYAMIRPRRGVISMLAGLARGERDLIIGLDAGRPNVRRHVLAPAAPAQRLTGYVAHKGPLAVSGEERDRFGVEARCDVIALDELPLDEAGELVLSRIEARNAGRVIATDRVLPRNDLERAIAAAWREVLGVEAVDVTTNFFSLGGQSIQLIQLLGKLKRSTGRDLTVVDLFRYPTVSALATHLGAAERAEPAHARALERAKKQKEAARQRVVPRGRAGERTGNR